MITYCSTQKDVHKECANIHGTLLKWAFGIDQKYKKWRKNNKSTDNIILQRSTYTINNNKVIVWWWGHRIGTCNFIDFTYLIEITNKDGSLRYIYRNSVADIVEFTTHFCKRLRERLGMSIFDLMDENIQYYSSCFSRDDVDENNVVFCINGIHIMGVKNSDKYYTVTTVINEQQEYANQTEHILDMERETKLYVQNTKEKGDTVLANLDYTGYNHFVKKNIACLLKR